MIAKVIVDISNSAVDRTFDYLATPGVEVGARVHVPFGARVIEGYCIALTESSDYPTEKIKAILETVDDYPVVLPELIALAEYFVGRYHLRYADMLRLFLPAEMRGGRVQPLKIGFAVLESAVDADALLTKRAHAQRELLEFLRSEHTARICDLSRQFGAAAVRALTEKNIITVTKERAYRKPYRGLSGEDAAHTLSPAQNAALEAILSGNGTYLLHGVTGSGKTEVYMNVISEAQKKGKTAIMLVPEIALTPQVLRSFRARFGTRVALLHSGLSAGERLDEWTRLREGAATIAVGARSAVFAPLENLGAIIIDEEHDSSYIAEDNPRFFTHEVAAFRAGKNGCPLVLGSATPSVESYHKAKSGAYTLLSMPERVNGRKLPPIRIVDMTRETREGNPSFLSRELGSSLSTCLAEGHQAILFLNRRGYAAFLQCRACGFVAKCDNCDVPMVYHRDEDRQKCHYCGMRSAPLLTCPKCGSDSIRHGAIGTERAEEEIKRRYPSARVLRLDNDTTKTKDAYVDILSRFSRHEADILIGTQMVAKGHDFPECTLVGVLEADVSLYVADYRSIERTFQLITQVSGRAGRASLSGQVVLQTYSPRHYVYRYAAAGDYEGFYEREINVRETTKFPPFCTLIRVLVTAEEEQAAVDAAHLVFDQIKEIQTADKSAFLYFKAMHAPLKRLLKRHRVQIVIRLVGERSEEYVGRICEIVAQNQRKDLICFAEINPQNLR